MTSQPDYMVIAIAVIAVLAGYFLAQNTQPQGYPVYLEVTYLDKKPGDQLPKPILVDEYGKQYQPTSERLLGVRTMWNKGAVYLYVYNVPPGKYYILGGCKIRVFFVETERHIYALNVNGNWVYYGDVFTG